MNALAIIIIAIWAQMSQHEKQDHENEVRMLKQEQKYEQIKYLSQIDSLKTIIEKSFNKAYPDTTFRKSIDAK